MSLAAINWRPSDKQLRPVRLDRAGSAAAARLALALRWHDVGRAGSGRQRPGVDRPRRTEGVACWPYLALSLLTLPLGFVTGELVLLIAFYGVFVPIGLLMRLLGRDDLQRSFDPGAATYWQPKAQPGDVASYLRQS